MKTMIVMTCRDNVGSVIDDVAPDEIVAGSADGRNFEIRAVDSIPFGFKMALCDLNQGDGIIKYGQVIGYAVREIKAGECVHVHNVCGGRGRGDMARRRS